MRLNINAEGIPELVSVIIPVYNHERYVSYSIQSVLQQTYKNIELIVIDDGSTDGSAKVIRDLLQNHCFTFLARANKGLSATINEGIQLSHGEYICILASDDIYKHHKIKMQVDYLDNNQEYAMCCSLAETIDKNGTLLPQIIGYNNSETLKFNRLIENNSITGVTVMLRRSVFESIGLFDVMLSVEDWDMWLRVSEKLKIGYIPEVVACYRIHDTNQSSNQLLLIDQGLKILNKWRKYDFALKSVKNILRKYTIQYSRKGDFNYLRLVNNYPQIITSSFFLKSFIVFLIMSPLNTSRRAIVYLFKMCKIYLFI